LCFFLSPPCKRQSFPTKPSSRHEIVGPLLWIFFRFGSLFYLFLSSPFSVFFLLYFCSPREAGTSRVFGGIIVFGFFFSIFPAVLFSLYFFSPPFFPGLESPFYAYSWYSASFGSTSSFFSHFPVERRVFGPVSSLLCANTWLRKFHCSLDDRKSLFSPPFGACVKLSLFFFFSIEFSVRFATLELGS